MYKKLNVYRFLLNKHTLRTFPEVIKLVEDFKQSYLQAYLETNLVKGIQAGLYRPEINVGQAAIIYLQLICMFFCAKNFSIETILAANNLYLNGIIQPSAKINLSHFNQQHRG
jgi:hypothetical protein